MIKKILFTCFLVGASYLGTAQAIAQASETPIIVLSDTAETQVRFAEQLSLFPNPASNKVIVTNVSSSNVEVTVYNILGDLINRIKAVKSQATIDVVNLPDGVYIVSFDNGKEIVTQRLVKS